MKTKNYTIEVRVNCTLEQATMLSEIIGRNADVSVDNVDADTVLVDPDNVDRPELPDQPVSLNYEDGECPDCGEPIPDVATTGESCKNCEHVFVSYRGDDDELAVDADGCLVDNDGDAETDMEQRNAS